MNFNLVAALAAVLVSVGAEYLQNRDRKGMERWLIILGYTAGGAAFGCLAPDSMSDFFSVMLGASLPLGGLGGFIIAQGVDRHDLEIQARKRGY